MFHVIVSLLTPSNTLSAEEALERINNERKAMDI
jgi:hypothetical protein